MTAFSVAILGTLRNNDDDRQREPKKSNSLISKTTTLHVHHAFWYISLLSLLNYDVKWPNFSLLEKENSKAINSTILSEFGPGPLSSAPIKIQGELG